MDFIKFWYAICIVFLFYILHGLVEQKDTVTYQSDFSEPIRYLVCQKLDSLFPNQTFYDLSKLKKGLLDKLEKKSNPHEEYSAAYYRFEKGKELINEALNKTRPDYLITEDQFCFILRDTWILLRTSLVLGSEKYFAVIMDTFFMVKMKVNDRFDQLISVVEDSTCSKSNFKFYCRNKCYKSYSRLSKYYYDSSDTGIIHLNQPNNSKVDERRRFVITSAQKRTANLLNSFSLKKPEDQKLLELLKQN